MSRPQTASEQKVLEFRRHLRDAVSGPINLSDVEYFNTAFEQFKKQRSVEDKQRDQDMFRPKLINKN